MSYPEQLWCLITFPLNTYRGLKDKFSHGKRWPELTVDHSPAFSAFTKNVWCSTSAHPVPFQGITGVFYVWTNMSFIFCFLYFMRYCVSELKVWQLLFKSMLRRRNICQDGLATIKFIMHGFWRQLSRLEENPLKNFRNVEVRLAAPMNKP